MGQEIERKFLVRTDDWKSQVCRATRITQGYLAAGTGTTARIRIAGSKGFITIKGKTPSGSIARLEFEYEIPLGDAEAMLQNVCEPPVLDKTRHEVELDGHVWEIDVFEGANAGLVIAEIELRKIDETFTKPAWVGAEVTGDPRYYNVSLVHKPFTAW